VLQARHLFESGVLCVVVTGRTLVEVVVEDAIVVVVKVLVVNGELVLVVRGLVVVVNVVELLVVVVVVVSVVGGLDFPVVIRSDVGRGSPRFPFN